MAYDNVVRFTSVVFCAVLLYPAAGSAGEKKITRKEVPAAILSAFEKAYPKAAIRGFSREEEEGKTLYEVESLEGKTTRDILYAADGKIAEIEEGIAVNDLPAAVRETVSKEYPKGKVVKAEKVTHESVVEYEVHVTVGKTRHSLVVDPAGKVVEKDDVKKEDVKR